MKKDVKTETPQAVQDFMDFLLNDDGFYLDIQLRNLADAICFLGAVSMGELPDNAEKRAIAYLQELSHFRFELQSLKDHTYGRL